MRSVMSVRWLRALLPAVVLVPSALLLAGCEDSKPAPAKAGTAAETPSVQQSHKEMEDAMKKANSAPKK